MQTEYLTLDELERRERQQVRRATIVTLLAGGAAFLPAAGFIHARLEAIASAMPPGSFDSLWMPVILGLSATQLALLFLVRTTTRHLSRRDRQHHELAFAQHRAATLERLFSPASRLDLRDPTHEA